MGARMSDWIEDVNIPENNTVLPAGGDTPVVMFDDLDVKIRGVGAYGGEAIRSLIIAMDRYDDYRSSGYVKKYGGLNNNAVRDIVSVAIKNMGWKKGDTVVVRTWLERPCKLGCNLGLIGDKRCRCLGVKITVQKRG
jgi:hypothetical protein